MHSSRTLWTAILFTACTVSAATAEDAQNIQTEFMLGLQHSLGVEADALEARRHFQRVINGAPRHVSAWNNLALTHVKLRNFSEAYRCWQSAAELAPASAEVAHNVGRFVSEAKQGAILVPARMLVRFEKLYASALGVHGAPPMSPRVGWLYMPPVLAEADRDEAEAPQPNAPGDAALVQFASGTGFFFHEGFLLTNRHVVDDEHAGRADLVKVVDPADPQHKRTFDARIVAVSDQYDLAILECAELNAATVPLAAEVPRRGAEIMIFGYPLTAELGRNIKVTRGIVTALPDPQHPESELRTMLTFDAQAGPGNSGGPVSDRRGCAVAIQTAGFTNIKLTAGIPATLAIPFVQKHVPGYVPQMVADQQLDWPDVDEKISTSTVLLLTYYRRPPVQIQVGQAAPLRDARPEYAYSVHDPSCTVCLGRRHVDCPGEKCIKGEISVRTSIRNTIPGTRRVITRQILVKRACPVCAAAGRVACPACDGSGRDASVVVP